MPKSPPHNVYNTAGEGWLSRLSVRTSVRNVRSRPRFPAEPTDLTAPEEAQLKQVFAGGGAKHLEPRRIFDETIARTR